MPTVYVTAPNEVAPSLARILVEERLAACVNRVPCRSTYRWDGEVIDDDEEILLAKTTDERYPDLVERVEAEHPYDVPCIERFEEDDVLPAFADWIEESTDG
ncbi:divalent-cation tolerance protein CutA [Halalkalicoccus ordinarius]|uniref:divalent-cation tolerance protein CutA n=1 Tax=Halalkalicoccus ordinarius TaxID=3116651 RepID=UPI00300E88E9